MIEVEKKFQPTEEQLQKLLAGAEFVSEKEHTDIYYDFPDYRLFKKGHRLRKRNDGYELKVALEGHKDSDLQLYNEIENDEGILEFLGLPKDASLQKFISSQMGIVCEIKTNRKKYKKDDFSLDVDNTDFGYDMVEIELLVDDESKIKEAEEEIISFAQRVGLNLTGLSGKTVEYLKRVRPEIYKEIYGDVKKIVNLN